MGGRPATGMQSEVRVPLLEREHELGGLREAIGRAAGGVGSLVVIEAPPGLGKSRLLAEAGELARAGGCRVLAGAGNELEREYAFGVVLQIFEPVVFEAEPDAGRLFEGAAELAQPLFGKVPGTPASTTEFPLLHGLYWLTSNLTEASPLFLAVDDLHWSDSPTLRFLSYLAKRLEGLPVLLATTLRPHEAGAPRELLDDVRDRPGATLLHPRSLGVAAVNELVKRRLPGAEPEFVDACERLTEGNPFLLDALLRGVEDSGEPPTSETADRLAQLAPENVLHAILARVARISTAASNLARAVAVLGPNAHLRTAAALGSLDLAAARAAADALVAADVLSSGDPLRFVHPLVRAVVYDDVPEAKRGAAHREAAALLDADGASLNSVAAHLLLAGREGDEWTVDTLERAAAAALANGAPASASAYLRRALAEPPARERRASVLLALGRAETAAGEAHAPERFADALELLSDPGERAVATLDLARALHSQSRYVEAAGALDRAIAGLDGGDERLLRELEATWVSVARLALPLRNEAVQRLGAIVEHPRGDSYAERLLLAQASGQLVFAGEPREQACALARLAIAGGALMTEGGADDQGWFIAAGTMIWSDDFETGIRMLEEAVEDARRRGMVFRFATAIYGLHLPHHYAGRLSEAAAYAESAIDSRHPGWREFLPAACGQLCWTLVELDEPEIAERILSLPELAEISDNVSQVLVTEGRARLHMLRGDPKSALVDALEAGRMASSVHVLNPSCLPWRSTAAVAALALGDVDQARTLAGEELRRARNFGASRPIGVALRAAGLAEGGERGVEILTEAVTTLAESPAPLEHARALIDLGAALRRLGHRADARSRLREGLEMVERFGARALERTARGELLAAGAKPRRRELSGVESLTPSELRVARMAAGGMSNREIAQSLFVTVKAVEFHLRNAYRKLDIGSRDELETALADE